MKTTIAKPTGKNDEYELTPFGRFFYEIKDRKECIWCGKKFKEPIVKKTPGKQKKTILDFFSFKILITLSVKISEPLF